MDDLEREQHLRGLGAEELHTWVVEQVATLEAADALRVLRHPFAAQETLAVIAAEARLLAHYEIGREVARHPRAPLVVALRMVATLFWRDHLEVAVDTRVAPQVRRLAEQRLLERIPSLATGERISLARRATPGLQAILRHDSDARVVRALLENPRLTLAVLVPLLVSLQARPEILALVAGDRRWGNHLEVRRAVARNPRTPAQVAVPIVALLPRADQLALARDPRLPELVRQRARLLSGAS